VIPPKAVGCPIRRSGDQRALAPPPGFSQRATSFIASRYQGIHQMPLSCRARAQPQARRRSDAAADAKRQMSDVRWLRARPQGRPLRRHIQQRSSDHRVLEPVREHRPAAARAAAFTPPPMLAHRQRIPMPRPDLSPAQRCRMMAGPASRSRLASRFHKITGQGTDDRPDGPSRPSPSQLAGPMPEDALRDFLPLLLCPLSSAPGGPGPI
jgi:hypothetical protein